MTSRAGAERASPAAILAPFLGTLAAGCSLALGITDITAADGSAADGSTADGSTADGSTADDSTANDSTADGSTGAPDSTSGSEGAASTRDQSTVDTFTSDAAPDDSSTLESAASDAGGDGGANACPNDLSNTMFRDFRISFTLQTTQPTNHIALLNQRTGCNVGEFWDIELYQHSLYVEISDVSQGAAVIMSANPGDSATANALNDGKRHDIVVSRVMGVARATVDGLQVGSASSLQSFGKGLPPLKVGTDDCEGVDGTAPLLQGGITNVCVKPEATGRD